MVKTGLKVRDVSPGHFSSRSRIKVKQTEVVVRIIEGKSLLASDIETGKSDPVCFLWCGLTGQEPNILQINDKNAFEHRVLFTPVCPTTCDPIWDKWDGEDETKNTYSFPLDVDDINNLMNMKFLIFVRDEDKHEDQDNTYDELGMVEFPFSDLINEGKGLQNAIVRSATWYELKKSPGMRKVEGSLKLTISINFAPDDIPKVLNQIGFDNKSSSNPNCGQLLQNYFRTKKSEEASVSKGIMSPLSVSSRPSSASSVISAFGSRKKKSNSRPNTAPILKLPSTISETESFIQPELERYSPKENKIEEEHNDDLVSEAGFTQIISNIEAGQTQNFRPDSDPENTQHLPSSTLPVPKQQSTQQQQQQVMEQPRIGPLNENRHELDEVQLDQKQDHLDQAQEGQQDPDNFDTLLSHGPDRGDENIFNEIVKVGVDQLVEAANAVGLQDSMQDTAMTIAQAILEAAKKLSTKSKVAIRPVGGMQVLPGIKGVRDAMVGGIRKSNNKTNSVIRQSGEFAADLLAQGPLAGDHFIDPELNKDEANHQANPEDIVEQGSPNRTDIEHQPNGMQNPEDYEFEAQKTQSRYVSEENLPYQPPYFDQSGFVQGNATAVIRILKELQDQRQFMQNTMVVLAKESQKGFKNISSRLGKLESDFTTMKLQTIPNNKKDNDEDGDFNFELDGGDQALPVEAGDDNLDGDEENDKKNKRTGDKNATYSGKNTNKKGIKADKLNKTISSNRESEKKEGNKASKSFRDFRKKARQTNSNYYDNYEAPPDERSPKFKPKRVFKEPEIQFVYKGENGDIATAKVATSPIANEAPRVSSGMDQPFDPLLVPPTGGGDQLLPPLSPHPGDFRASFQRNPRYSSDVQGNTFPRNSVNQSYFAAPISPMKSQLNRDFCEVLDKGALEDVSNLLESSGALPEQLSVSTRNRLYDVISTLLLQGKHTERCLIWVLALIRSRQGLLQELTIHTQKDLLESLKKVSKEASKRGMLATLLVSQISRQVSLS